MRPLQHEHFRRAVGLAGILVLAFAAWVESGLGGETAVLYFDDIATAAAALAATVLCVRAGSRHSRQLRTFWWLLAGACAGWSVGELIWGFYEVVLGTDVPAASWADAGYLAAIPVAAAALLVHPSVRRRAIGRTRSVLDGLVIAAALFFVSWLFVLDPLQRTSDLSTLGGVVTLAYPAGDVVILFLVVLVIRGTTSGSRRDLWWLLGGLLAISLSDSVYGYLTQVKGYESGNLVDVGWFAGYLAIGLGAYSARSRAAARRAVEAPSLSSAALIAPFLPLFAALCLMPIQIQLGHELDGVALTTAFVLVGLVLLRQALLLVDLFRPGPEHDAPVGERVVSALGRTVIDRRGESSPSAP
jgi:uncharacterized membrane protein YgdD (TMEM256/DUF423 family)